MPGAAYGLDAFRCRVGSLLAEDPSSTCHGCYARKNFYRSWRPAIVARARREEGIHHPYWVEAMICLILDYVGRGGEPAFRWHDSGDLHGWVERLTAIKQSGRRTWLGRLAALMYDWMRSSNVTRPTASCCLIIR